MKSKKATKRALLSSALSLVLCFAMMLGTTFAWFTDEATTSVNTIVSGTLDVDLVDTNGDTLVGETLEFVKAEGASANEAFLWEPGCTYVTEGFKVANLGDLWLKYQLVINGIDGDAELLDVIDFWITDNNESLEKAVELGTYLGDLAPRGEQGDKSDTYYLVGHMKEDANNDYQDLELTGVGVTVYATQKDAEYDSFGNDYDVITLVSTPEELKAAVEAGGNVMLANDITATDLMMTVGKNVTTNLYLNGKTIAATSTTANRDGKEAVNSADNYVLFNVAANGSLNIIGDGKITVNHTGAKMGWNAMTTAVHAYGDVTVSDGAEIINYGGTDMAFGLNAYIGGNITVKDSTVASAYRAIRVQNGGTNPTESTVDVSNSSLISYTHNAAFWHHVSGATSGPVNMIGFATEEDAIAAGNTIYGKVIDDKADPEVLWIGGEDGEYALVSTATDLQDALAAATDGTTIVLAADIALTEGVTVPTSANVTLDLNGKTLSGETTGAVINNNGTMTITGGTVKNDKVNGGATINNNGTMVLDDVAIVGAPISTEGDDNPEYAVITEGKLTVEAGTSITADCGAISMINGADVIINGGDIEVTNALGSRVKTIHVIKAKGSDSKLTIYDGNFALNYASGAGVSVICPYGAVIEIYDGNFTYAGEKGGQSGVFQNYMGCGDTVDVYGGTYNDTTFNGGPYQVSHLAAGYVAVDNGDGTWTVTAE